LYANPPSLGFGHTRQRRSTAEFRCRSPKRTEAGKVAQVAILLGRAFEQAHIPYAIGGALAYGFWGIPRATLDVDVNVFVEESELNRVADALSSVGVFTDCWKYKVPT
jgi:hypothetical protein